jgi:serine/threonine protein kinase/predicted ATPase
MREGDLIAGSFLLEQRSASGGMGSVFRGRDLRSGVSVAVKTWLPVLLEPMHETPLPVFRSGSEAPNRKERALLRFEREARVLAAIEDPAVVRYVAHGTTDSGEPFLVMHWVDGQDLATMLRDRGLCLLDTLQLAARLVPALGVLHRGGIVHRDLKPANIVLAEADVRRAVIVDFGVARRSQLGSVTVSGTRVGTPCYMAPEQIRDPRQVDGRADVFALGCVLFECLAGVRAFASEDALGAIAQILLDGAPDLRSIRPELPTAVGELVARLLSRDREQRPWADRKLEAEIAGLVQQAELSDFAPPRSARVRAVRQTSDTAQPASGLVSRHPGPEPPSLASKTEAALASSAERLNAARFLPGAPLIGRADEFSHLLGLRASGANVIVLWGAAGIGKTRLALELALAHRAADFEAESWFIDLSAARGLDDALRILTLCTQTRVSGSELVSSAIGRTLSQRPKLLVVLDAVDGLTRELGPMLGAWQGLVSAPIFVVTSRERLRWPAAVNAEIGPLQVDPAFETRSGSAPERSAAAEFFQQCVREHQPGFVADETTQRSIEQLVLALEGIPLAIELAAARVSLLGLEGVLSRLARPLSLLSMPTHDSALRGTSAMHDAIRTSFDLLSADERAVLECCALFPGAFTVAAAETVAAAASSSPAIDVLQSLREKSLLCSIPAPHPDESRLCLFRVIRDYALSELRESGRESEARARHGTYSAGRVAALLELRRTRPSLEALRAIEAEADDLMLAIEYALSTDVPRLTLALEAWLALEPAVIARGPLPAFVSQLDRTIACSETNRAACDPRSLARVLQLRGRLRATSGRFEQAERDLELSRALGEELLDPCLEGLAWLELGVSRHFQRRLVEARVCYERALALIRNHGELRSMGRCYGNLGAVLHDEARLTEAAAYYWKAIHLLEEAGETRELANFLSNLAVLEQELGAFDSARRHYDRAIVLLSEAADSRLRAIALGNLGALEAESGNWPAARLCHAQALELLLPLNDGYSEALCRARLGAAWASLGFPRLAETELALALRTLAPRDPARLEAVRLQRAFLDLCLAKTALSEHAPAEAKVRLEQAEARVAALERPAIAGVSLSAQSDDIRMTLRVLKPLLSEFRCALSAHP